MDEELGKLMALLPGLEFRFERMKADLVIKLLTQPQGIAARLVALRAALPAADIAAITTTLPSLLTDQTPEELTASVQGVRCDATILLLQFGIALHVSRSTCYRYTCSSAHNMEHTPSWACHQPA